MTITRRVLSIGCATALVAAAGYFVGTAIGHGVSSAGPPAPRLHGWQQAITTTASLAAIAGALLAHELGHLAGGRFVGFRPFLLIVGPVRLERGARRWRWRLNTDIGLAGGLAGAAPLDGRDLRRRTAVMVAGGPAASALVGLLALVAWWWCHHAMAPSFGRAFSSSVLLALGSTSLLIAVATLLPMRTSGFLSDGARLLRLRAGGPVAERDTALQAVLGASMSGVRPRDWDAALVEATLRPEDGTLFEAIGWQLAMYRAADAGRPDDARAWLDRILAAMDRFPPALQVGVRLDAARQLALWGAVDEARTQLASARGPAIGSPYLRPAAEAAVLAAEGNGRAALARIAEARATLDDGIDAGGASWVREVLGEIEQRALANASPRLS